MTIYIGLNGYKISVCQESIFRDAYFRNRLINEIYPAVQAIKQYIKLGELQSCLEALANVKPNDKIKRLQKSSFTANSVPRRLDEFCKSLLFQLEMWKRRCEEPGSDVVFARNTIDLIVKDAWESATHHIIGV